MMFQDWIDRWRNRRSRDAELRILMALRLQKAGEECRGAQLAMRAGLSSARFYPAVARLELYELVTSRWKDTDAYPRPRLYKLTARGW